MNRTKDHLEKSVCRRKMCELLWNVEDPNPLISAPDGQKTAWRNVDDRQHPSSDKPVSYHYSISLLTVCLLLRSFFAIWPFSKILDLLKVVDLKDVRDSGDCYSRECRAIVFFAQHGSRLSNGPTTQVTCFYWINRSTRGTESTGMVGSTGNHNRHFEIVKGLGLVRDVYTQENLSRFNGMSLLPVITA